MTTKKSATEQKLELLFKITQLNEDYATALYYETMPEYDPLYCYSYQHSNMSIPYEYQSVDAWVRAVIKHMGGRKAGHGGGYTKAYVASIPTFKNNKEIELWLEYVTRQLRKRARVTKQREPK